MATWASVTSASFQNDDFESAPRAEKQVEAREERIAFLERRLKKKDEVPAPRMEERVALRKRNR